MLNLTYVPTNEQLFRMQLKRPRFYVLRNSPNTESRGYIEPREVDGRLRWTITDHHTGEVSVVPLNELRNARMYAEEDRNGVTRSIYLFVYEKRGGPKHYYVVSSNNAGTWLSQTLRMDMLSEENVGSISSARNINPSHPLYSQQS